MFDICLSLIETRWFLEAKIIDHKSPEGVPMVKQRIPDIKKAGLHSETGLCEL
jgi:hypothetical protein